MTGFAAQDARFDAGGWAAFPAPPPFTQRHLPDEPLIFCETVMTIPGDPAAAVALIDGPWTWWHSGRAANFRKNADGSTDQVLSPVWWYTTRIGMHMHPPAPLADASGTRLSIDFSRQFTGRATMDVIVERDRRLTIRGRFHGVENHVPLIPLWLVANIHMRAEAGTLRFPFPRGTGWPGLAAALGDSI